jgi:two-component system, cell cycle response regulator DivK
MRADRERALVSGFDGYLEKPISVRDLPDLVRRHARGPIGSP